MMIKFSLTKACFLKTNRFNLVNYGFYYGIGAFLVAQIFFFHWYRFKGEITPSFAFFVPVIVASSTVFFSKVLYILYNYNRLFKEPKQVLNETGYAFFGGFVGLFFSIWLIGKYYYPNDIVPLIDFLFLALPLGQIFQRIGCITFGCCYGHAYNGPLAVSYKNKDYKAYRMIGEMSVHHSQMYSLFKNVALLIIVNVFFFKFSFHGVAFYTWLIIYGVFRFLVDFTRYTEHANIFGLRITQIFSIIMFIIGIFYLAGMELIPYEMLYPLSDALKTSLKLIPYSLIGFLIMFIFYGYHSTEIGLYIAKEK